MRSPRKLASVPTRMAWKGPGRARGFLGNRETDGAKLLLNGELFPEREQVSYRRFIINYDVEIGARRRHIRMRRRGSHLGQRPPAGQRMRNERVPAVVNR